MIGNSAGRKNEAPGRKVSDERIETRGRLTPAERQHAPMHVEPGNRIEYRSIGDIDRNIRREFGKDRTEAGDTVFQEQDRFSLDAAPGAMCGRQHAQDNRALGDETAMPACQVALLDRNEACNAGIGRIIDAQRDQD